ncbi:MAG: alpha/beta hydrolase [Candidatus Woesearchaeota archaeon]
MKEIWYIHGANCSSISFNRIVDKLPKHKAYFIDYDSKTSLDEILHYVWEKLPEHREINLIGHSLGGIISILLSHEAKFPEANKKILIDKIVTISSPLGGSIHANLLRYMFPEYKILKGISTKSEFIESLLRLGISVPTLSLVSIAGNLPTVKEKNDGIVTISSQKALKGPTYIEINANHFEILQSDETIKEIKNFLFKNIK